ncbi:MAG: DUF1858 domain-containing protein [Nanoarchaeota archaeon]
MEITGQTLINHLISKHPETIEILMSYGLHCVNCHFSDLDTLGDGAMMHGISDDEVRLMIKDVNKIVSTKNSDNNKILNKNNKGR